VDWYAFWKLLHIASAIVAVGTNLTYFVWLRAMRIMVLISPLGFTTFWIAVAIGLYVLLGVFGGALFVPALRRLAAIVNTEGPDASGYADAVRRVSARGLVTMLPVAGILYLMVFKPTP
jgi:hypothetical protein